MKCCECGKDVLRNDYFYEFDGDFYCEQCIDNHMAQTGYSDEDVSCCECGERDTGNNVYYKINGALYCDVCVDEGHKCDSDNYEN